MTFLERVLAQTSGPACPAAADRFASLDPVDRELVAAHVAGCAACREELARSRWNEAWRRVALRPRFALEAAYVGAVVLCVIGTFTDLHLRAVPDAMRTMISQLKETP